MKRFTRTALTLAVVLGLSLVMTACGAISSKGGWKTLRGGQNGNSITYTFAKTNKSYGKFYYYSASLPSVSVTSASYGVTNVNSVKITKNLGSDPITYSLTECYVFIPADVKSIQLQPAVDTDPAFYYTVSYTKTDGADKQFVNVSPAMVKYFKNYEGTKVSSTRLAITLTSVAGSIDTSKDLTIKLKYNTNTNASYTDFTFTFQLGSAVLN